MGEAAKTWQLAAYVEAVGVRVAAVCYGEGIAPTGTITPTQPSPIKGEGFSASDAISTPLHLATRFLENERHIRNLFS